MSDDVKKDPTITPGGQSPLRGGPAPPGAPAAGNPAAGGDAAAQAAPAGDATSDAPSQQELAIRSALETVNDPEIMLSVIDLGLIREVKVEADRTLIRMLLTTPFCPYAPQLMAEVKAAVESVVPQPCEVEILTDPWSPDLMPDPGLLGFSF